ncbi:MAG TPA: hydrogenase 4 subunit B [Nitrospiria bacterium]|nr:hydrogenase 4 subunit B [Nitrospiria bacterium]
MVLERVDWLLMGMALSYLLGAAGSLAYKRSALPSVFIGQGFPVLASFIGMFLSWTVLRSGAVVEVSLPARLPLLDVIRFVVDPLAAFFIMIISAVSLAASVYSFDYLREHAKTRSVALFGAVYNLFLFSLVAVTCASNGFVFLMLWELMSLSSFFLVNFEHDHAETRKAAFTYLLMTHVGTAFILVAFLLSYSALGTFDFGAIKVAGDRLSPALRGVIFFSALVGFGTKAGLVPLHIWLPAAHPAAPSNVSALMSGVMIKMAVYGIVRLAFDLLGIGPWWWGFVVLFIASTTALVGIFYAIEERDLKRLLAYSSIENIGIVFVGVGTAMIFSSFGLAGLSALALTAALYHALNHAVFKGLLFLGAGAVVSSVGMRDMEEMGGLIRRMPYTGFFFLVGAVSISALPPFNGFVSEWLTLQSLLLALNVPKSIVKMMLPIAGATVAMTGALAAVCFVKAFGIGFLAMPRGPRAREAHEVGGWMRLGMGILALPCLLLGVLPGGVISLLERVTTSLSGIGDTEKAMNRIGWTIIPVYNGFSSLSAGWLLAMMAVGALTASAAAMLTGGRRRTRVGETWACGIPELKPRMQYTATGYSKSIRVIFRFFYRPQREVSVLRPEGQAYVPTAVSYQARIEHVVEKYLYDPVVRRIIRIAERVKVLQSGSIHAYLAYLFVTLVAGLVLLSIVM